MHADMHLMEPAPLNRTGHRPRRATGSEGKEPLQVRIPTSVKRRFKSHAASRGLEPNALFLEVWAFYEVGLHSGGLHQKDEEAS